VSSTRANRWREYRRVADGEIEVYLPVGLAPPEELHLTVRRFPRRVSAYWNGSSYVVASGRPLAH
jgi:hypothetical protein